MAYVMCPHYNQSSNTCKCAGGSHPSDYTKKEKCLSSDAWLKCANFKPTK